MFKNALIMAAGNGMRMMPITHYVPKPLVEYNNIPLIDYSINLLKKFDINIHVTVSKHKTGMLSSHLMSNNISSLINTNQQGNAWWIYKSLLSHVNEPLIVLTCDNIMELDLEGLYQEYLKHNKPSCMIIPTSANSLFEGDFITHENNKITQISRESVTDIYASGCQIINPNFICNTTSTTSDFYTLWNQLINQQQLFCSNIKPTQWKSIDSLSQILKNE